ncbi:hypothetical protein ZWY2020_033883 [Hordeum vulgare]|nr:hypothetical protein ZWY2020_033883 [Hordeum vulgare]
MVVVPVAAAVGIAFAVLQWVLVSKVKVTTEPRVQGGEASASGGKYGASEYLIEEEEGLNDHNVVLKCVEIQTAISEADMSQILQLDFMYLSYFDVHLNCFEEEFQEYAEKAKTLPDTTTNESKLCLYRLYKQATVGPVNTGIFTFYAPFLSFPYY